MTLKTVEQWYFEGAPKIRFEPGNNVSWFQDFAFWKGELPSDRDFFVTKDSAHGGRVWLVARGFGAKDDYGNGSISIDHDELPPLGDSIAKTPLNYPGFPESSPNQ